MPVRIINKGGNAVVEASGSLSAEEARDLHARLTDALEGRYKSVSIDLSAVTELDVPCMQVLCAAHKSADKREMTISISMLPQAVEQAVSAAGILRNDTCGKDITTTCLWSRGGAAGAHGDG